MVLGLGIPMNWELLTALADRKPNEKNEFPASSRPMGESANVPMPGCRALIPSEGKRLFEAVSCYRTRSIETQTAVRIEQALWEVFGSFT